MASALQGLDSGRSDPRPHKLDGSFPAGYFEDIVDVVSLTSDGLLSTLIPQYVTALLPPQHPTAAALPDHRLLGSS